MKVERTKRYGAEVILYGDVYDEACEYAYELAEKEGITEQLKAQAQMTWVQHMNNIRNRAEEIILKELIYGEATV